MAQRNRTTTRELFTTARHVLVVVVKVNFNVVNVGPNETSTIQITAAMIRTVIRLQNALDTPDPARLFIDGGSGVGTFGHNRHRHFSYEMVRG